MILKSTMIMMRNNQIKKYNLFFGNPEFTRNVWQEFTLQRLLVISVVWMLIVLAIYSTTASIQVFYRQLAYVSFTGCLLVGIFWGTKLINDSLLQEFTEGTWDSQRMSGLSALQLVIGKLFGSSIMAWFAILVLLCSFIFSISFIHNARLVTALQIAGSVVFFILATHLFAMFSLLMLWRKQDRQPGKGMRLVSGIPFLVALLLLYFPIIGFNASFGVSRIMSEISEIRFQWFFVEFNFISFFLMVMFFWVAWFFIGVWQQMRVELQFRLQPWWWLCFLLFWLLFGAGFMISAVLQPVTAMNLSVYLFVYLFFEGLLIYGQLLYARKDAMFWLRFSSALKSRNYAIVRHLFPGWLTSVVFGLVLAGMIMVLILFVDDESRNTKITFELAVISSVFFLLRDVALSIWLNLSSRQKRADTAWLFYLFVLYTLLPWLFSQMISPQACYVFLPLWLNPPMLGIEESALYVLSPILQTLLMLGLVWHRWGQRKVIPIRLSQRE